MIDTSHTTAFAAADIGPREILEDYSATEEIFTMGGLHLRLAIVCDGVGGAASGERAAFITAQTVIDFCRNSSDTVVPRLLTDAIQDANRKVFNDNTAGKSTIAMIAVHYDGSPFGRAYIASVGDSGIFLIRDGKVRRLNTEHNVANDLVWTGQATREQADALPNAWHLTRAIGVNPEVDPDIGFYYNAPNQHEARQRGKSGILLEEGDTLWASSDGLTDSGQNGIPYVTDDDFLRHALDDNVERTARMYLTYALRSGTHDNVSIALLFVDSKKRHSTDPSARGRLSPALLVAVIVLLIAAIGGSAFFFSSRGEEERGELAEAVEAERQTGTAAAGTQLALVQERDAATQTAIVIQSFTPTPTQTFTPSPTSTPSPTLLPAVEAGNAGYSFLLGSGQSEIVPMEEEIVADTSSIYVSAFVGQARSDRFSYFYLQQDSSITFLDVSETKVELYISNESDVFIQNKGFDEGSEIFLQNLPTARFSARESCMSIQQTETEVRLTCFSGDCGYSFRRVGDFTQLEAGQSLLIDVDDTESLDESELTIAEARRYDAVLLQFNAPGAVVGKTCAGVYIPEPTATPTNTPTNTPRPTRTSSPTPRATATRTFSQAEADDDRDGIPNGRDNCFGTSNANQADQDDDGIGDVCDSDVDGDGVANATDACASEPGQASAQGCPDADGDGVRDTLDNCLNVSNASQTNTDGDSQGDACDSDDDGDGVADGSDNCPLNSNSNQANNDGDSQGDICDSDDDNDGDADGADNCPTTSNSDQANTDGDSQGDACDSDDDNDGDADGADNCPLVANSDQLNTDGDSQGDACDSDDDNDGDADGADNCPTTSNSDQANTDGDSQGDACDSDDDNDGDADGADNCPTTSNSDQANTDGDAQGNACDSDDDGDGVADGSDNCPLNSNADQLNTDGDAQGNACDSDDDGDGVADGSDNCSLVANGDQLNTDGDAQGDACDSDDDNDGHPDSSDNCPLVANSDQLNTDGDAQGDACDSDDDNDGVSDDSDGCPLVSGTVGGCPDGDGDGIADKDDACPSEGPSALGLLPNGCPIPLPEPSATP